MKDGYILGQTSWNKKLNGGWRDQDLTSESEEGRQELRTAAQP